MALDPDFQALLKDSPSRGAPSESAQAAQSVAGNPQTLHVGFGRGMDTHIHLPAALDQALVGGGAEFYRLGKMLHLPFVPQNDLVMEAVKNQAQSTGMGKLGGAAVDLPIGYLLGGGVEAALPRLGSLGARIAANPIALGAAQGATQGAALADSGERLQGAIGGGLLGAALPAGGQLVKKLATGIKRAPEAQELLNAGVDLTPGLMNPQGAVNAAEQASEGIPILGNFVRRAREAAPQSYTRAQIEQTLPAGARLAGGDAHELIDQAQQAFDAAYQHPKGFEVGPKIMRTQGEDIPLKDAINQVVNKPRIGLTAQSRDSIGQELQDLLQETITDAKRSGGMMSDHLLALRSTVRDAIRGEQGTDNASRAAKALYRDVESKITEALDSQLPPDASAALKAVDSQYAKFKPLEKAVARAKDAPGGPTPFQISTAIAEATPKGTYAAGGGGATRDLSKAARAVFTQTVPKTGFSALGQTLAFPANLAAGLGAAIPGVRHFAAGSLPWQRALLQIGSRLPLDQLGLLGRSAAVSGLLGQRPASLLE